MQDTGVLLSNAVRHFVRKGGKLDYEFSPDGKQKRWFAFGITPNGDRLPIIVVRTGQHKEFRNANAVVNYHEDFCPESDGVFIAFKTPTDLAASQASES